MPFAVATAPRRAHTPFGVTAVYSRAGQRYYWSPSTGAVNLENTNARLCFRGAEPYVVIGYDASATRNSADGRRLQHRQNT
jgi:hypothetical protein